MGGNDQSDVREEIDDDTDIFELITFNLSPIMGGRSEVMKAPFMETLKYLELQLKRIEHDRYNDFMNLYFSNRRNFDEKKGGQFIQDYIKTIEPQKPRKKLALKTDVDQLKKLLKEQEERAKSNQGG